MKRFLRGLSCRKDDDARSTDQRNGSHNNQSTSAIESTIPRTVTKQAGDGTTKRTPIETSNQVAQGDNLVTNGMLSSTSKERPGRVRSSSGPADAVPNPASTGLPYPARGLAPDSPFQSRTPSLRHHRSASELGPQHTPADAVPSMEENESGSPSGFKMRVRQPTWRPEPPEDSISGTADADEPRSLRRSLGIPSGSSRRPEQSQSPSTFKRYPPSEISNQQLLPYIMPERIKCCLHVTFEGSPDWIDMKEPIPDFDWKSKSSYDHLSDAVQKILAKAADASRELREDLRMSKDELYLRHGSCRVRGFEHDSPYNALDQFSAIDEESIKSVCGFIHDHPLEPFSLEIHMDYSWLRTKPSHNQSLAYMIRGEIKRKTRKNFLLQSFISRIDLQELISPMTIKQIVEEDEYCKSIGIGFQTELFGQIKIKHAYGLFAICVLQRIKLQDLHHLIAGHGFHDKNLPQKDHACQDVIHKYSCMVTCEVIREVMHSFFAKRIQYDPEVQSFKPEDVLPIIETDPNLGAGAHSIVKAVTIDPAHHLLSGNPLATFALKEFLKEKSIRFKEAFDREVAMLGELAKNPHRHITSHIACWEHERTEQDLRCYILYPKATGSLRAFMEKSPKLPLNNLVVAWFISQLTGLASALSSIHQRREDDVSDANRHRGDPEGLISTRTEGFHHDIKPDNILVFMRFDWKDPVFKLADFGAGQIRKVNHGDASNVASAARGTEWYFGPEIRVLRENQTSRPFDMWALGCVFLELMIWFLQSHDALKRFHSDRGQYHAINENTVTDNCYWCAKKDANLQHAGCTYCDNQGDFCLRPAVVEAIGRTSRLSEETEFHEYLGPVIDCIKQLFRIDHRTRMDHEKLVQTLEEIRAKAVRLRDVVLEENVDAHPSSPDRGFMNAAVGTVVNSSDHIPTEVKVAVTNARGPGVCQKDHTTSKPRVTSNLQPQTHAIMVPDEPSDKRGYHAQVTQHTGRTELPSPARRDTELSETGSKFADDGQSEATTSYRAEPGGGADYLSDPSMGELRRDQYFFDSLNENVSPTELEGLKRLESPSSGTHESVRKSGLKS